MTGLSAQERLDRIRLIRTTNVGPITHRRLLERFGTAGVALAALPELARRGGRSKAPKVPTQASIQSELATVADMGGTTLVIGDTGYPPLLAATEDAPAVLHVLGNVDLLRKKAIAVVGARAASAHGRRFATAIATDLGAAGYMVVSGI